MSAISLEAISSIAASLETVANVPSGRRR